MTLKPLLSRLLFILLAVCFVIIFPARAAAADTITRPRVAVVLSGGGAKGMAHIGALKVIERAGIPIDIITGTSMGSLIGGLYACGWDAAALDSIVRRQDWSFLLSDKWDYYSQTLRERNHLNTYILTKRFTVGGKSVREQGGVIEGRNLMRLFRQLTYGYTDSMDFSRLPIPFACVATNIVDNTEYDFHNGVLSEAMRSSMSIPGVFSPVRKGDMVLVDGGLRNNYPADIAREMGAKYIIGATVQGPPKTADELVKGTSILGQIVDVNCKNKYEDNLAITDIALRINTQGYNAASFTKAAIDTLIARGEHEAMKHWDELMALKRKLGLPDDFRPAPIAYRPESRLPVDYTPTPEEKNKEHDVLRASLGVRFDIEEMVALQLDGMYQMANRPFDFEATLRLGKRIMTGLSVFRRIRQLSQWKLNYTFRHNDIDFYQEGKKSLNTTYNQHTASLSLLGLNIRNMELDISARWDYYDFQQLLKADNETLGDGQDDEESNHFISYHAMLHYNSENDAFFPRRGAVFVARYAYFTDNFAGYNGHRGFSELAARWRISLPLTSSLTLQPLLYGRMLFGKEIPAIRRNAVGGMWFGNYIEQQMPFAGTHHIQTTDRHFLAAQLRLQEQLTTNNFLLFSAATAVHANQTDELLKKRFFWGCEVSYFYRTILGPLGASLGYSNVTKDVNFYLNLGYQF